MENFFKAFNKCKAGDQYAQINKDAYIESSAQLIETYKHYGHPSATLKKLAESPFWLITKDNELIGLNELTLKKD